jgi:hypothetical protein
MRSTLSTFTKHTIGRVRRRTSDQRRHLFRPVKLPESGSNNSAVPTVRPRFPPPASNSFPVVSKVALYPVRDIFTFHGEEKVWATVSYSSAFGGSIGCSCMFCGLGIPPRTRTFPPVNRMALCPMRVVRMLPDEVKLAGEESYNSLRRAGP